MDRVLRPLFPPGYCFETQVPKARPPSRVLCNFSCGRTAVCCRTGYVYISARRMLLSEILETSPKYLALPNRQRSRLPCTKQYMANSLKCYATISSSGNFEIIEAVTVTAKPVLLVSYQYRSSPRCKRWRKGATPW